MGNDKPVFVGLYNPKSPSNVGSVMRAAGCYQVAQVRYTGGRFERAAQYQTDTKDIVSSIPLLQVEDLLTALPDDMKVVCVEFVEGATSLPGFVHPDSAIYIFGPEDGSVPQQIINEATHVIYVPTVGCMNLAATVNVLLYDRLAKLSVKIDDDALIKSSRDTNNRLRIK